MSKANHTPGPWKIGFSDGSGAGSREEGVCITADDKFVIRGGVDDYGVAFGVVGKDYRTQKANAHLIAASLLYYEAAEAFLQYEQASEKGDGVAMMIAYDKFSHLLKQAHAQAQANGESK